MKQANNVVNIEGILNENNLDKISYTKDGKTVEAISGHVVIRVRQEGKEPQDIPVYYFQNKFKKDGNANSLYEALERAMNNFKSVASVGSEDLATKIRITNGQIAENRFIGGDGNLRSFPRIKASFLSEAKGEFTPKAAFNLVFVMSDITTQLDPITGQETKVIKAIVPQYGDKVDLIDLECANDKVALTVENYWKSGNTVSAAGRLEFKTDTVSEEMAPTDFGEAEKISKTIHTSKIILTGGSQVPLTGENAYSVEDIKKALVARTADIETLKAKTATKASTPNTTANNSAGFNWSY